MSKATYTPDQLRGMSIAFGALLRETREARTEVRFLHACDAVVAAMRALGVTAHTLSDHEADVSDGEEILEAIAHCDADDLAPVLD